MFSHVASADPLCHCIQGGPFPMTWRTHGLDVIPIGLPKAANIIVHHFLKTKMETDKKSLPAKCVEPRAVFLQVLHIVANPPCIFSWRLYVTYMYRYIVYVYHISWKSATKQTVVFGLINVQDSLLLRGTVFGFPGCIWFTLVFQKITFSFAPGSCTTKTGTTHWKPSNVPNNPAHKVLETWTILIVGFMG